MIVYVETPGKAPERVPPASVPLAARMYEWAKANGYRGVWIIADEGARQPPPDPSCYELEREDGVAK